MGQRYKDFSIITPYADKKGIYTYFCVVKVLADSEIMVKKLYICIVKRATTILHQLQSITPGAYLVLCALVVLVALGSCTPTKDPDHILERIAQADAIKESNPTQACDIMRSIDRDSIVTEEGLARYALVYSEACYFSRGYIDVDSLSSIALRFYSETDMHNEHARAQFQQAYVMYNANKHPETMIALLEAEKLLEHCDNERLLVSYTAPRATCTTMVDSIRIASNRIARPSRVLSDAGCNTTYTSLSTTRLVRLQ